MSGGLVKCFLLDLLGDQLTPDVMRIVIDTCCLQDDRLDQFLRRSVDHIAVLTDFTLAEIFKGDALRNAGSAWKILSNFPEQIIILKPLEDIVFASTKRPCLVDRFIAIGESREVSNFSAILDAAREGDPHILDELNWRTQRAEKYMEMLRGEQKSLIHYLNRYNEIFSQHERRMLRNGGELPERTSDKFLAIVNDSARQMMQTFDRKFRPRNAKHLFENYCFRHSLTYHVYVMSFYQQGKTTRNIDQAGNDVVDIVNVALSTYFNGLMTNDALPKHLGEVARFSLKSFGAWLPKPYLSGVS